MSRPAVIYFIAHYLKIAAVYVYSRGFTNMCSQMSHGVCLAGATGLTSAICFFIASSEYNINANGKSDRVSSNWTRVACGWAMISFVGFNIIDALAKKA